ncbi:MAG TPA: hypothetical protein DHU56_08215 [Marinobacter sp.]|nr:hypothetical protein [Marinobacter sp.]
MAAKQIPKTYAPGYLDELDGRLAIAQVMRERYRTFTDDLGGADRLSYPQRSLVERALWLEYWLAQQEQSLAKGKEFDVARWTQAANSLQGILTKLGLNRVAKDVPDLHTYLKQRATA